MIINLFGGPGGMDQGARIINQTGPILGYDLDADACATATAAGFQRTRADVRDLDPEMFSCAHGALITPPCPPYSRAGRGRGQRDYPRISQALGLLGDYLGGVAAEQDYQRSLTDLHDERSALVVETLRFAFMVPGLSWLIAEQVPGVAQLWKEIGAELAMTQGWRYLGVVEVASEDLGLASRRRRTFLIATRHYTPDLSSLPMRSLWVTGKYIAPTHVPVPPAVPIPARTMASALGWPPGELVNTRGNRRATGGNVFSADRPAWCLTEKARTWYRVSDGLRLTPSEAGLLMGFPPDYPWQGSRSKRFLQIADAVSPVVAAAVLGATLGRPWRPLVRSYLTSIYPSTAPAVEYVQPTLFGMELTA